MNDIPFYSAMIPEKAYSIKINVVINLQINLKKSNSQILHYEI